MKVHVRLLRDMKINVFYRERDFINKLPSDMTIEEKRQELHNNREKYFWFLKGHQAISAMLFYCRKKGYVVRRKRTERNFEYKRVISLRDLEAKK